MALFSSVLLAQGAVRPPWIGVLPSEPGRVYALGVASLGQDRAQSVKQAGLHARAEVVARLRATVKGDTRMTAQSSVQRQLGGPTTASSRQTLIQESSVQAKAADLPGLAVLETWVDEGGRTVYALACLEVARGAETLLARSEDLRRDLEGGTPVGDLEKARAILKVRKGREELVRMDGLAELLVSGGAGPGLRTSLQAALAGLDRHMADLRNSVVLNLADQVPADLAGVVRAGVTAQGLGWSATAPDFTLRLRATGAPKAWRTFTPTSDFVEARAAFVLEVSDQAGRPAGVIPVEAMAVGTSEVLAEQALVQECRRRIQKALEAWLESLAG